MGYLCDVRHWSPSLSQHFSKEVSSAATKTSNAWAKFLSTKKDTDNPFTKENSYNPFTKENSLNYIVFQPEGGISKHWMNPPISESFHWRMFRWIIGLHKDSRTPHYHHEGHCLGGNHFLGEGLFCSSSSVISGPMFDFHLKKSSEISAQERTKLKENIVLIDNDAIEEISATRLQADLRARGLADAKVLVHEGRKRLEVPELYTKVKVALDCRNPGLEYINLEGTLYDILTLACSSRVTRNVFDFPIPNKYRLEPSDWPKLVSTVHNLLVNYTEHVAVFATFKKISAEAEQRIPKQVDAAFFSRDTLFRYGTVWDFPLNKVAVMINQ